jgi:GRASP55/65 PDZ-like domain
VFNSTRDDVRLVSLRPRLGWSEEGGLLGAELASGILHRIPQSCRRTSGKDRLTFGDHSQVVRTPEGVGHLVETLPDESALVRLDWGLGPDVQITGQFAPKNVEVLGEGTS